MSTETRTCSHCPARFEGDDAGKELRAHVESFHPAGAPVEVAITSPAIAAAVGKDFGPAVGGVASGLADAKTTLADHEERLKALEDGRRSETDLAVLADQLVPRLGAAVVTTAAAAEPPADEGPSYKDLQARARELDLPAVGTKEALAEAIAAEELRLAQAALAAREGTPGGDSTPASEPDAPASGEAGTPPEK